MKKKLLYIISTHILITSTCINATPLSEGETINLLVARTGKASTVSSYSNSFSLGIGFSPINNTSLYLEYSEIDNIDKENDNFNYFNGRVRLGYPINERVHADIGIGLGLPINNNLGESYRTHPFPLFEIGFRYDISDELDIGIGYRNLYKTKGGDDSINNIFLSIDYKFDQVFKISDSDEIFYEDEVVITPSRIQHPEKSVMKTYTANFETNKWKLNNFQEKRVINELSSTGKVSQIDKVLVVVNTDGRGSKELNQSLTEKRGVYSKKLITKAIGNERNIFVQEKINYNTELFKKCRKVKLNQRSSCLKKDRELQITTYYLE